MAIYNAILRKDPEVARAAMRAHLSGSYKRHHPQQRLLNRKKCKPNSTRISL